MILDATKEQFTLILSAGELRAVWKALDAFVEELGDVDLEYTDASPQDIDLADDAREVLTRLDTAYRAVELAPDPPEFRY